ncbi:MAG: DUF3179 domain-containing protein [Ignavibacteriae bacterium]|nr:DUF3179 domain-containing protein [Ignavibacteriota bacterium]
MSSRNVFMILLAMITISLSCNETPMPNTTEGDWLIPKDQVKDGGPGKDGIPALTNPNFINAGDASYLKDDDLVLGVFINGEARAYPHPILDWHEIINDDIKGTKIAVTYCPLTGTGIGYNPVIGGQATTFGVSGLLYNSNLIPYDRQTNSNWSQMLMKSVNGRLIGTVVQTMPLLETRWDTWKTMFPETKVVSTETGYDRSYGTYPYGSYRTSDFLIFPISNDDRRLPRKERVHGVIVGNKTRVYQITSFSDSITTINDTFNGTELIVVGSHLLNFAVAYERTLSSGTELTFSPVQHALPVVMIDTEGTKWDIFGKAVSGARAGTQLKPLRSYTAYWFAWGTFFPGAEIDSTK